MVVVVVVVVVVIVADGPDGGGELELFLPGSVESYLLLSMLYSWSYSLEE